MERYWRCNSLQKDDGPRMSIRFLSKFKSWTRWRGGYSDGNTYQQLMKYLSKFGEKKSRKRVMLLDSPTLKTHPCSPQIGHPWWLSNKRWKALGGKCQRHYHTEAICWKIHGKPTNWVLNWFKVRKGKNQSTIYHSYAESKASTAILRRTKSRSYVNFSRQHLPARTWQTKVPQM